MGKVFETIDQSLRQFIEQQRVFFVATAPLQDSGLINVSPKGLDSLRIVDPQTVIYADLVGSGVETIAHLKENRRIVLMFCAFEGPPKIVRLHGQGEVIEPHHEEYAELAEQLPTYVGIRSVIRVTCQRISDSCGWGVPLYEFKRERKQLTDWAHKKGRAGVAAYQHSENRTSLDGLPGITTRD